MIRVLRGVIRCSEARYASCWPSRQKERKVYRNSRILGGADLVANATQSSIFNLQEDGQLSFGNGMDRMDFYR
jgi:hypothetical protein